MRLVSWISGNDLDAAEGKVEQSGAISAILASTSFTELHLLYSYPEKRVTNYLSWLSSQYELPIVKRKAALTSPIDFHDIYLAADALLAELTLASSEPISVLLSSDTPAMQAVWILLGKTKYPFIFYQASPEQGVQQVDIPFDDIVTQNSLVFTARDVPVLVYGETGIGKELFTTAIHNASPRKDRIFVPVNLIDSIFNTELWRAIQINK